MEQYRCENCKLRAFYDKNEKSLIGRFWRWHIKYCKGWETYVNSLSESEKTELKERYKIK